MGANAVLDITIGLVLMYLVLSLIGTVLNEFIATKLKLRASTLQAALQEVLDNPRLRADFYNHGLVDGTNKAVGEDHVSYLSGQTFAMAVIGSLDPTKPLPGIADVKSAIETLPDCNIRDVLLAHLATANGNLETLRNGLASYFDTAMDRVSGTYKRYLKWISLGVGFVLVIFLNADSISVGTALWKDASLRAQMVESAGAVVAAGQPSTAPADEKIKDIKKSLEDLEGKLRPLPIGWPDPDYSRQNFKSWKDPLSSIGIGWLLQWLPVKLFGLLLSALAVSLGAPFWFDMLSKFMNVRGSGPQPERSASPQQATN